MAASYRVASFIKAKLVQVVRYCQSGRAGTTVYYSVCVSGLNNDF